MIALDVLIALPCSGRHGLAGAAALEGAVLGRLLDTDRQDSAA